jgi:hemerythrin
MFRCHCLNRQEFLLAKAKSLSEGKDSIAVKLYEVMKYHFSEEEQYVFPPLGILPVLAEGNIPKEGDMIISLTMRFKSNSAKILAEHQMIKTLIEEYKLRSKTQNDIGFDEFERELAEHAQVEEEIYFPAAIVVGDYLKFKTTVVKQ